MQWGCMLSISNTLPSWVCHRGLNRGQVINNEHIQTCSKNFVIDNPQVRVFHPILKWGCPQNSQLPRECRRASKGLLFVVARTPLKKPIQKNNNRTAHFWRKRNDFNDMVSRLAPREGIGGNCTAQKENESRVELAMHRDTNLLVNVPDTK